MSIPIKMETVPADFIRDVVADDLRSGKYSQSQTRFPPEPNGYLHLGHAKSICLNFGIAREFAGVCNLRMDDTNPTKEESEYVESIREDVNWLIHGWADHLLGLKPVGQKCEIREIGGKRDFHLAPLATATLNPDAPQSAIPVEPFYASDYFDQMFEFALRLIEIGKAYVDDLSPEDTDSYRIAGKSS